MNRFATRMHHVAMGALLAACVGLPALADDTEIYRSQAALTGAKPNVLFIMDTSGSMDTEVESTVPPYDPLTTYAGSGCQADRIYYSVNSDTIPTCAAASWIPAASNKCKASMAALGVGGPGTWPTLGNPRRQAGQFRLQSGTTRWRSISGGNAASVDCIDDEGNHGAADGDARVYIYNGGTGWDTAPHNLWSGSALTGTYRFYSANYLNYKAGPGAPTTKTRLEIVRDVAINLASSLQGVNLGVMRYSEDAEGGYVLHAVEDIATSRNSIVTTLQGFAPSAGNGGTPLSETFYEAALYLRGGDVDYGRRSRPGTSVAASRVNGSWTYKSPLQYQCQKNYVVYLTDGAPTVDTSANDKIASLIGRNSCAADPFEPYHDGGWIEGSGICMDDLAAWMSNPQTDLAPGNSLPGNQTALTYMIGFGSSLAESMNYMDNIARSGGTEHAYTASDVPTLTAALQTIFSGIQEESATFVTPSIAVNAFNRAQTSSDLFFSVFKVGDGTHWPGNLKKYRLDGTTVVDQNGANAVDAAGFFASGTTSYWSPAPDGNEVSRGGAASQLPAPAERNLYTSRAGADLTLAGNAIDTSNSALTDAVVGTGASTITCSTACQNAINWARGLDVDDDDHDSSTSDQVNFMGDPLHGRPAVVSYGGSTGSPDATDAVVFTPTNDGFLHAFTAHSGAGGGRELWAYMPPELLGRLGTLRENLAVNNRSYGLDGDIRVLKLDKNQDGIVTAAEGDRVWLFFGMRSGGDRYYALDVTDRARPRLLWNIGPTELPGVGETWSPPVVTRVNVSGAAGNTDAEKFVLIFGGGYDRTQENQPYSADTVGNRIYIVEASTGRRLWYGGGPGTGTPDLLLNALGRSMNNSIPGRITVIDTDGDLFADRMYAADMGGRLWRFDIFNGQPRSSLVTGGVIAKLGAGGVAGAAAADNRRFYNAPDVALVQHRAQDPYYNIAIGSGYRGHPLDTVTHERFYAIRDQRPYAHLTQAGYNALTPVLDGDLVDITGDPGGIAVAAAAPGWKLSMNVNGGWSGEKVLSEATTVNNVILFTSFQPLLPQENDPCYPSNVNRVYAVKVDSGGPALDFTDEGVLDRDDLFVELRQRGIVGDVNVAMIRDGNQDPDSPPGEPPTVCVAGVEILNKCVGVGGTIRTFWERRDAE